MVTAAIMTMKGCVPGVSRRDQTREISNMLMTATSMYTIEMRLSMLSMSPDDSRRMMLYQSFWSMLHARPTPETQNIEHLAIREK
jgi:hypothetical protein